MAQHINGVMGYTVYAGIGAGPYPNAGYTYLATLARTPNLAKRKWAMWAACSKPWGGAQVQHGQPVASALQPVLRTNRNSAAMRVKRYNQLNSF